MSTFDKHVGSVVDGKYHVVRRIGVGGMGAVFLATHLGTERLVALKLISPRFASDDTFVERFRREARAAGRLRHPNIVDVTDFGFADADGEPLAYLVMEYLDGCSLADVLEEDPQLPLDWVIDFFDQLASAVDEAHRQGIVHRDLKPANVWLEPNRRGGFTVKVLDFGLARLADRDSPEPPSADNNGRVAHDPVTRDRSEAATLPMVSAADLDDRTIPYGHVTNAPSPTHDHRVANASRPPAPSPIAPRKTTSGDSNDMELTRAGTLMGTPPYMSPEQCGGHVAGPASDIYTLGVIVYEMLAGRTPFEGDLQGLLYKHAHEEPEALDVVASGVSKRVSDVVMASLAKDPSARPVTAGLFAAALRAKAESWRILFRQAVIVCADHYPLFLRISIIALLPYLLVRVLDLANFGLEASGTLPHVVTGLTVIPLLLLALVTSFLASVVSRGVATLVLAQLLLAPLSKARVRLAVSAILPRLGTIARGAVAGFVVVIGPLIVAVIAVGFAVFFGGMVFDLVDEQWVGPLWAAVLCAITTIVAIPLVWYALRQLVRYQLFPVVLLVEDLRVRDGLRRSRELAKRSMRDVASVTVVTFLPLLMSNLLSSTLYKFTGLVAGSVSARIVDLVASEPIVILADPFVSVVTGLLYLKLRRAEGERIEDILNRQFADQELPQRRWQMVLSSGSLSQPSSGRSDGGRDRASE